MFPSADRCTEEDVMKAVGPDPDPDGLRAHRDPKAKRLARTLNRLLDGGAPVLGRLINVRGGGIRVTGFTPVDTEMVSLDTLHEEAETEEDPPPEGWDADFQ